MQVPHGSSRNEISFMRTRDKARIEGTGCGKVPGMIIMGKLIGQSLHLWQADS